MNITLIGIDLAKNIFQVCGVNQAGKSQFNRQVRRAKLMELLAQYPVVPIAMEACNGSNYWGRTLHNKGHEVLLIPPQHVKPFVKGNKNDRNDAFAICEAAKRPDMSFVKPKTLEQTDMALTHRIRSRQVAERNSLINQIRGLLSGYGVVVAQGKEQLKKALPSIIEDAENDFRNLLNTTKTHVAGVKLVIGEPFYVLDTEFVDESWVKPMKKYQAAAKRISDEFNTVWIPFQKIFDEAQKYAPGKYWAPDGVHPSMAGSQLMAQAALHVGAHFVYFPSEAERPEKEIATEVTDLRELLIEKG